MSYLTRPWYSDRERCNTWLLSYTSRSRRPMLSLIFQTLYFDLSFETGRYHFSNNMTLCEKFPVNSLCCCVSYKITKFCGSSWLRETPINVSKMKICQEMIVINDIDMKIDSSHSVEIYCDICVIISPDSGNFHEELVYTYVFYVTFNSFMFSL